MGCRVAKREFSWVEFLFSFHGRVGRSDFWLRFQRPCLLGLLTFLSLIMAVQALTPAAGLGDILRAALGIVLIILYFGSIRPSLAVSVKCPHDCNKSGWWILMSLVPVVGPIWLLIECGCLGGTAGSNRFGADPVADHAIYTAAVFD